jgi:hypothetical protein
VCVIPVVESPAVQTLILRAVGASARNLSTPKLSLSRIRVRRQHFIAKCPTVMISIPARYGVNSFGALLEHRVKTALCCSSK